MNEMVERVARAITPSGEDWTAYTGDARAAIKAMRNVSHRMEDVGINRLDDETGDNNVKREHLVAAFQAMIDAALAEP